MTGALGGSDEEYGDGFWDFHADAEGDWPGFAACVLAFTHARTVVDVGCGDAKLLAAMRAAAPTLDAFGYDGSAAARARAARRGVEARPVDLVRLTRPERERLRAECARADTAICLEVAEHLLPWHAARLLRVLTACPTVVFSAAHPWQGGTLHVNERPAAYWIGRFAALGYELHPDDAEFRRSLAALRLPPWYAQNAHLFVRRPG